MVKQQTATELQRHLEDAKRRKGEAPNLVLEYERQQAEFDAEIAQAQRELEAQKQRELEERQKPAHDQDYKNYVRFYQWLADGERILNDTKRGAEELVKAKGISRLPFSMKLLQQAVNDKAVLDKNGLAPK